MIADAFPPAALLAWLTTVGWDGARLDWLPGDVSPRRYVRVFAARRRAILALYPEALRPVARRFEVSTALLAAAGVRVPAILASDAARGIMLLEDLGPRTLYERRLSWSQRRVWFERAARTLAALFAVDRDAVRALNPPLDETALLRELEQTWTLYLEPRLRAHSALAADLRSAFSAVCAAIGQQDLVVCHRDFMARNLVPLADGQLAVLDHQDLRLGPAGYDWASLLNDSLFAPPELAAALLDGHAAVEELAYRRAAVQRGFKAAGTFLAFAARGSDKHLPLVAPTVRRAVAHLARLPEGRALAASLRKALRD